MLFAGHSLYYLHLAEDGFIRNEAPLLRKEHNQWSVFFICLSAEIHHLHTQLLKSNILQYMCFELRNRIYIYSSKLLVCLCSPVSPEADRALTVVDRGN